MHIHVPFIMYCSRLFVLIYILLNLMLFIGLLNFISLPSFMIVSAMVSEICELNQNKKMKKEKTTSEIPI